MSKAKTTLNELRLLRPVWQDPGPPMAIEEVIEQFCWFAKPSRQSVLRAARMSAWASMDRSTTTPPRSWSCPVAKSHTSTLSHAGRSRQSRRRTGRSRLVTSRRRSVRHADTGRFGTVVIQLEGHAGQCRTRGRIARPEAPACGSHFSFINAALFGPLQTRHFQVRWRRYSPSPT